MSEVSFPPPIPLPRNPGSTNAMDLHSLHGNSLKVGLEPMANKQNYFSVYYKVALHNEDQPFFLVLTHEAKERKQKQLPLLFKGVRLQKDGPKIKV